MLGPLQAPLSCLPRGGPGCSGPWYLPYVPGQTLSSNAANRLQVLHSPGAEPLGVQALLGPHTCTGFCVRGCSRLAAAEPGGGRVGQGCPQGPAPLFQRPLFAAATGLVLGWGLSCSSGIRAQHPSWDRQGYGPPRLSRSCEGCWGPQGLSRVGRLSRQAATGGGRGSAPGRCPAHSPHAGAGLGACGDPSVGGGRSGEADP